MRLSTLLPQSLPSNETTSETPISSPFEASSQSREFFPGCQFFVLAMADAESAQDFIRRNPSIYESVRKGLLVSKLSFKSTQRVP